MIQQQNTATITLSPFTSEILYMLTERIDQWIEQWKLEGYQEAYNQGYLKGYQEGYRIGQANALYLVLQGKFGDLPAWVSEKINNADSITLKHWLINCCRADQLEAIFT
ncbi:hypothetical protein [Spartinivicinus ruber]|uniref:hypothetical protein n=1 Tax=Spartinivicinus ruber TaxID=2683272 RepID=UPI0013D4E734|nr:hypothetical protein [Spartinivicinus ruber]